MNISKKFDDILTSPLVLWGISVGIAVFMWFYIMNQGEPSNERRKFLCRLEYRNLAAQMSVKNVIREIEVEVEGPENVMSRLKHDSIRCDLDLSGLSSGRYRETVRTSLPQNVTLIDINPSEVDIELIRQASRVFPVDVVLPQDIPAGQYLESAGLVPREIAVRGSEKDLAKIGSVTVAPTSAELESGKELLLPVKIVQSEAFEDEVTIEPAQVKMNATLVRGLPRKKVNVNVRLSGKPSADYAVQTVTTDPAEVLLEGPKNLLDAISAVDTDTVDISELSGDQAMIVPLRPLKEKDVSIVETRAVRLQVRLAPIAAQKQFAGVPVVLEGAGEKKWTISPAVVNVTVEASPSRIESLDINKVGLRAYVDVSNLFLRTATLPVRVAVVSGDLKAVKTDPPTVTVKMVDE